MAAGEVKFCTCEVGYNDTLGYYIHGVVMFKFNNAYVLKDDSVRIYYPTWAQVEADLPTEQRAHVDLVPPDSEATGAHILKAESWQKPYITVSDWKSLLPFHSESNQITRFMLGLSNDYYVVTFTIPNLNANTKYAPRAILRLFKKSTSTEPKKRIYDPSGKQNHKTADTSLVGPTYEYVRPLFGVAKYENANDVAIRTDYWDFTDCIKLPSYDVNSEDVNEDWEDANYEMHRIIARKKITGKFEMIFPTMERQKEFFYRLEQSKQLNGFGIAYVELKVHVNNVLDPRPGEVTIADTQCLLYEGKFFIKIDNNAWIAPIHGHYDKYSPLSITITEA